SHVGRRACGDSDQQHDNREKVKRSSPKHPASRASRVRGTRSAIIRPIGGRENCKSLPRHSGMDWKLRRGREISLTSENFVLGLFGSVRRRGCVIENLQSERVELSIVFRNDADHVLVSQSRGDLAINDDEIIRGFRKISATSGRRY